MLYMCLLFLVHVSDFKSNDRVLLMVRVLLFPVRRIMQLVSFGTEERIKAEFKTK